MSYFDDASLVMIPSGYKDQKVYSVKPLDGSGDLTFSRASSATRVQSNGLIEKVRTNLQTYSQDFSATGGWGGDPVTATKNYGTAPDGTQTSTRLQFSSANYVWQQSVTGINGNLGVFSLYIKGTAGQTIQIAYGGTDKLVTIGTGWTRVNTNGTVASSGTININTYGVNARDFEVWGGQTELGDIATDYIATTSAAVSVGPVSGLPRLDYLNSTCPRLLLEPQRTNLKLNSENFSTAAGWSPATIGGSTATFTANYGVSPDGYQNADRIQLALNGGSYADWISYNAITNGTTYTYSVYIKSLSGNGSLKFLGAPAGNVVISFTTEWVRYTHTFTATGTDLYPRFLIESGVSSSVDILVYGAQLEAGAYATSYIPTLGTSVTRVADAALKTGISSLIGQTEGTLYAEFDVTLGVDGGEYFLSDNTNVIALQFPPSSPNTIRAIIYNGGGFPVLMDYTYSTAGLHKVAYAYKANDFVLYVDGVQRASDTSGTVPACSIVQFGGMQRVSQALVFKTRLSNSDLAALTA
jgi:hypothetical protein